MESPFPEGSKEIVIKTCVGKESLTPQKISGACECCAVRKRLPASIPDSQRLTQAKKLGVLEAKNVIGIYEKKKEEAGIGTSSFTEKSDSQNNLYPIIDKKEEIKEEMLFVEDLYDNENNGNDLLRYPVLNKYREPREDAIITEAHKKNISSDGKDVSLQYIQNCKTEIIRQPKVKEVNEIYTGSCSSILKLSAVSVQCNLDKFRNIDGHTENSPMQKSEQLQEREDRLKHLLHKLLGNQKEQSQGRDWDKYINDLRTKHRSYDQNIASYEKAKFNRNPISPTSSHRKLQSTILSDNYSDVRRVPRSYESTENRSREMESLSAESPSHIDSPISCFSKIPSYSKFRISYQTSGSDFCNHRRTALCYPSFLSDQIKSHETNRIRNKHLCRNIFSIPKPMRKKMRSFDNSYDDFYTFPEETKQQKGNDVFRDNLRNEYQTEPEDFLMSVQEESNYSIRTNDINRRMNSTKTYDKESVRQNHNTVAPINNNSGSGTINSIENKLDKLIDSIHALIKEVKSKGTIENTNDKKNNEVPLPNNLDNKLCYIKYNKINKTKSDPVRISTGDQILKSMSKFLANSDIDVKGIISPKNEKSCEIKLIVSSKTRMKSTNTLPSPHYGFPRQPNQIRLKPRRHHIICDETPHALEITVDFLVKSPKITEKGIETIHLMDQRDIKQTKFPETKSIIAHTSMNTEPLSFGELSRETIKKISSLFPLVGYYWSCLPIPTIGFRRTVLECEICNKTFSNVAELNRHKVMHNFDKHENPTSCLLCQESLNKETNKRTIKALIPLPKLFSCRHCGETFTRAYAKQLHELNCSENKHPRNESTSFVVLS